MTPGERASHLTKWVAADLRPRRWGLIRDSVVEALGEAREACAPIAEAAEARYTGSAGDLRAFVAFIAAAIHTQDV